MKRFRLPILAAALAFCMSSSVFGQDNAGIIKNYIDTQKAAQFKKSDLKNFAIDVTDQSTSLKSTLVKFQQTYNGLPIFAATGTALVKDGVVTYFQDDFVRDYNSVASKIPSLTKETALAKIATELGKSELNNYPILDFFGDNIEGKHAAKQRLIYFANANNKLVLAHEFTFPEPGSHHYWNILVDAHTGAIVEKLDMNVSCTFHDDAYSKDYVADKHSESNSNQFVGPHQQTNTAVFSLLNADNASYNIFPFPVEAPTFGSRQLTSNPWDLTASPNGWHKDGTTSYTYTRGNNVYAYEDTAASNLPGYSPDGGATRTFDYAYTSTGDQYANLESAITSIFYANNKVHDLFYKFGFTEANRNFQSRNFTGIGQGNDYVFAEAQDGTGTNNANFSSPQDGANGRMQMYMWSPANRVLTFNGPTALQSRVPIASSALYGVVINPSFVPVTADLAMPAQVDGCTIPVGTMTDKIAFIEKGGACTPTQKTKNAQLAGAKGVIIYDDVYSASNPTLTGSDTSITIPTVGIRKIHGDYIKSTITGGATANATIGIKQINPDSDFDNGVIAHEYGHGVSNRMTGQGYSCLNQANSKEQMGEGWSDFFAVMFTNRPGDDASVPRGIATYVNKNDVDGSGIRPARYSPDFAINNYTYGKTNGMQYTNNGTLVADSHSIGFVWATMLWDLHWNYVNKYGYASDVTTNANSGSARVLQLVMDALKLQGCSPTFVSGRDAIIAADQASNGGADRCMIWRTFAKRGLGVNASAGSKLSIMDQIEDFTVPADCVLATDEVTLSNNSSLSVYPNPAKDEFYINFPNKVAGTVSVDVFDASGKIVKSVEKVSLANKDSISTAGLVNGVYYVKVKGLGLEASSKLIIKK